MMSLQKLLDSDVSMAQNYVATLVARLKDGDGRSVIDSHLICCAKL